MWINNIEIRVNKLIEDLLPVEVKRLQIEYIPTIAKRLESESVNCEKCLAFKSELEEALSIIENAEEIKENHRRNYNAIIKRIIKHLTKEHQLKAYNHYRALYSNVGLVGGILGGIWFIDRVVFMILVILTGPLIGKILGYFRDQHNKEDLI